MRYFNQNPQNAEFRLFYWRVKFVQGLQEYGFGHRFVGENVDFEIFEKFFKRVMIKLIFNFRRNSFALFLVKNYRVADFYLLAFFVI